MASGVWSFLAAIGSAISGFFNYKASPNKQYSDAEGEVEKRRKKEEEDRRELERAVYEKDDAKVNEIMSRLKHGVSVFALIAAWGGLMCVCVWMGACVSGCETKPELIYIPTDRQIESCTNSRGIECKAVPNAVFCELVEAQMKLEELKRREEVKERLSK